MGEPVEQTVTEAGQAEFRVRGSRFISQIQPASSVETAERVIEGIAGEYDDATHNVPAYRIRESGDGGFVREWSSDDGEPRGTAGPPALNVLSQQELVDVVVVITRFYGGTNLGTGGLHRAYSQATVNAIDAATLAPYTPTSEFEITVPYEYSGTVRSILESNRIEFDAAYSESVTVHVVIPDAMVDDVIDRIRSATHGDAEILEESVRP